MDLTTWTIWIPIAVAAVSLLLSAYQFVNKSKLNDIARLEKNIDRAQRTIDSLEAKLDQCKHDKDELRREKYALLEQLAMKGQQ